MLKTIDKRLILLAKDGRWCQTFCIASLHLNWKQKITHSACCTSAIYLIFSTIGNDWTGIFKFGHISGGYQYLLVLADRFSSSVQVYATTNKSAKTATDCLYNDFVLRYIIPRKILHDQEKEFEKILFPQLSKVWGTQRLWTTPYHPQLTDKWKAWTRL